MATSIFLPKTVIIEATPAGINGQLQINDDGVFGADSGLNYNKTTDALTINGSVIVPLIRPASTGNIPLVFQPSGTSGIQLQVADNTAVGGNTRGPNAIDFQLNRSSANEVASGESSFIAGGVNNIVSGVFSFASGFGNNVSGSQSGAFGASNTISGSLSFVTGNSNDVSGTLAFATGITNTVSAFYGFAAGTDNIVSGNYGFAAGGRFNTSSGLLSFTCNNNNIASGTSSFAGGSSASTKEISNLFAFGSNSIGVNRSQVSIVNLVTRTTDAISKTLVSDANTPTITNQLTLQNNSSIAFTGLLVATTTAGGDCKSWEFKGQIQQGADASTTALVSSVTPIVIAQKAGASSWTVTVTADTTNGCLLINVTGETNKTIIWNCTLFNSEVSF